MTFKHMKFEDSPTMRALEKVAKEKGLVKPETLQKRASIPKKADYTPSSDLMENILKLCSGLRSQGLEKQAAEIETNFLNYKRAQTLYETSKEKGEDLIHDAHPKGSHKLEGVAGEEATVEDILDQHMKILEKVNKTPTGKLSTAGQVLNEVKKALGQLTAPKETESELSGVLNTKLNEILAQLGSVISILKLDGGPDYDTETADEAAKELRAAVASRPFTRTDYRAAQAALKKLQGTNQSGLFKTHEWFGSPDADDPGLAAWNKRAGGALGGIVNRLSSLNNILTKLETIKIMKEQGSYQEPEGSGSAAGKTTTIPEVTVQGDPLSGKLSNLVNKVLAAKVVRSIARNPQAMKWIDDQAKEMKEFRDSIEKLEDDQRQALDAKIKSDVATYEKEVNDFYAGWVNAGNP